MSLVTDSVLSYIQLKRNMEVQSNTDTQAPVAPQVPKEDLGAILWQNLVAGNYESAVKEIKEQKHHEYLVNNSLELVPVVCKLLQEKIDHDGESCVEDLLNYVGSVANPKEAVLVFLEVLETQQSAAQLRVMLRPVQTVLLRQALPQNTRTVTFSWVFNTLYARIAAMNTPEGLKLEGKERKLLDMDPLVMEVSASVQHLVHFYEGFYTRVVRDELAWGGNRDSREYLAMFLLQLYHKPLTFLDVFDMDGKSYNALYSSCRSLTTMVATLLFNVFKLFSKITWTASKTLLATESKENSEQDTKEDNGATETEDDKDGKDGEVSQLSLSCFFYCVLGQHMASECVPQVYSHQYVYLSCLPLVVTLLQEKEYIPIHKGLMLAQTLLDKLPKKSLPSDCLEATAHSSFPQLLIRVMTFCDSTEIRTMALGVFRPFLRKFDSVGRRKLIQALLLSVKHAGVLGLVIHELKENVAFSLKEENLDPNFSGRNLVELTKMACSLPEAEKTDLLDWSDCIMPALNLLIYLFMCDRENRTGIASVLPSLRKGYLQHLQTGLELTKVHYELKLKELSETSSQKGRAAEVNVSVAGETLPSMPQDQEKKVVEAAICTLDMMQCVLARTQQAIDRKI